MAAVDVQHEDAGEDARGAPRAGLRERRCIVSRQSGDAAALIRFARAPDGTVVPDIKGMLPGRGCWVEARRQTLEQAISRQLFSRAFKAPSRAASDLADQVERLLKQDALGLLGLARKAGVLALGETQVVEAARAGKLAVAIHASDGAGNGLKKVHSALTGGGLDRNAVVREFTTEELSLALGLANVIHAGLPAGRFGTAFAEKARKLAAYRGTGGMAADFTRDCSGDPAATG